jgi:hypothetical protein
MRQRLPTIWNGATMARVRLVTGIACVCWLSTLVHAQPAANASEADRLFDEGRALALAGKYADACERFQHSFDLDHATGTELNLGDCHEQLGHLRRAWELFTSAAEDFERAGNPARTKFARDRAAAVAAKLATIVLHVPQPQPDGLAITIAGRVEQPRAEVRDLVEPGAIEVTASAPGRVGFVATREAIAGAVVSIDVPALEPAIGAAPQASERRRSRVHVAWALGAAGGAALTLVARSHYDDVANDPASCTHLPGGITCTVAGTQRIHDAQHLADIGTGFAVGCAVTAAAALVVYLTAPRDVVIAPSATSRSVGLVLDGRF